MIADQDPLVWVKTVYIDCRSSSTLGENLSFLKAITSPAQILVRYLFADVVILYYSCDPHTT